MSAEIDQIIDRYLEHPEDPVAWEAARAPGVFPAFTRRCRELVISEPNEALTILRLGIPIVTSACDLSKIWGQHSTCYRNLGDLKAAFRALESAFQSAGACRSCKADLFIRRSLAHGAAGDLDRALPDVDAAIAVYRDLSADSHDPDGLAKAYNARGDIQQFIGIPLKDEGLIQGAIEDFSMALRLTDPEISPGLYKICLFNLAVALYATGNPEDLARSYGYLSQARRRMGSATSKPSQERGKLAWLTAMVENELIAHRRVLPREVVRDMNRRGVRPFRVLRKLSDAVSDFVKVGMPQETTAAVSDHAKVLLHKADPDPDYGAIRELVSGVLARLERRFELPDVASRVAELDPVRRAVGRLVDACSPARWDVYFRVREAIDGLRNAAGPGMIPCLIRWRDG